MNSVQRLQPAPAYAGEFSFREYMEIIKAYKPVISGFDAVEADNPAAFCLIRHDVEFSLPKALQLAQVDHGLGVSSTFFIQVKNGAYNPLAPINTKIVRQIRQLSHAVGLHFYITDIGANDTAELFRQLEFQTRIIEEVLGEKITSFSYHRPPLWALKVDTRGKTGLLNAYDPKFFELTEGGKDPAAIKYMADSQHAWKYGHPLVAAGAYSKFQILMHPDEWSEAGTSTLQNFEELMSLHQEEFKRTLATECNHFKLHFPVNET